MMDEEQKELHRKLDVIIGLLARNIIKDLKLIDQVATLDSLGMNPIEISRVLGKSRNNIDQNLHKIRSQKKKKTKSDSEN